MDIKPNRKREIHRLRGMLSRLHYPRLQMALIVGLTGAGGFVFSFVLLQVGFQSMGLRYGLAVFCAYAIFLGLLWCWLRIRSKDLLEGIDFPAPDSTSGAGGLPENANVFKSGGGQFGGGGATASIGEPGSESFVPLPESSSGSNLFDFDLEELGLILLMIAALLMGLWASFWIIYTAPAFLAELLLDAALAAGLYKRIKNIKGGHWLGTAVKKTILPFTIVAILCASGGALMQSKAPSAHSIGDVWRHHKLAK